MDRSLVVDLARLRRAILSSEYRNFLAQVAIALKSEQQLKGLVPNPKHAGQSHSFDAVKAIASVCGRLNAGSELIDDRTMQDRELP